ncbi:MAG: hypothetical protein H0T79_16230 [Deltaproteobacteria bacterium]|nr:hypothetical protein [Deltaproteobacteria bacterium]
MALAMAACGAGQKPMESLGESVRSYNEGVRWERFAAAAVNLPSPERARFVDEWDQRSADLKVTDYEVVKIDPKDAEAKVQVKLSWYRTSEGTLRETQAMQTWERHGKTWLMVDETRLRGAEMPGLVEPRELPPEPVVDPAPAKSARSRPPVTD